MPKLAVPVSGKGSLLDAMISQKLPIALVIADRECRGVEIAISAGIDTVVLPRVFGETFDRDKYTLEVVDVLQRHKITLIAMAGYLTVLAPVFFEHFANRILNIHPSLLPAFKGEHAVKDALEAGVKITGTTIHIATEHLDAGLIIAQEAVRVLKGDDVDTLHERIKVVERRLYPEVIKHLLTPLPPE